MGWMAGVLLLAGCAFGSTPSTWALQDRDGDRYLDRDDLCPEVWGNPPDGCPGDDADGDGVKDIVDRCPRERGIKPDGCPGRDSDGDGVIDVSDKCRAVAGVEANHGCPVPDSDGDGVIDVSDKCPAVAGVEANHGCPVPDSDGDKIDDLADRCPREPETRNGFEDDDGCDDAMPRELAALNGIVRGIVFVKQTEAMTPGSAAALDRIADLLRRYPTVRIEVAVHTEGSNDAERRAQLKTLSIVRAAAIEKALMIRGIDERQIEPRGAGGDEPLDSNASAAGRARNRRVEVQILVR